MVKVQNNNKMVPLPDWKINWYTVDLKGNKLFCQKYFYYIICTRQLNDMCETCHSNLDFLNFH